MMVKSEDLHEDHPMRRKLATVVLGLLAFIAFSWAAQGVGWVIFVDDFVWDSAPGRRIMILLPVSLLVGGAALWGLIRLKPWAGPISPTTRKANLLILLSGLVLAPAGLVLFFDTFSADNWFGIVSNSAISPGAAIFAIASLLVAIAIGWWGYYGSDEHERRANDVGLVAGGGLFVIVTPAWWLAARAGLLPMPDAMVLWCVTIGVAIIVWFWYRYR